MQSISEKTKLDAFITIVAQHIGRPPKGVTIRTIEERQVVVSWNKDRYTRGEAYYELVGGNDDWQWVCVGSAEHIRGAEAEAETSAGQ